MYSNTCNYIFIRLRVEVLFFTISLCNKSRLEFTYTYNRWQCLPKQYFFRKQSRGTIASVGNAAYNFADGSYS